MKSRIKSLQNISVVKCAVLLSLAPEIKREILCVPESEYSANKLNYQYYRKEQWIAIIQRKAQKLLKYREFPEILKDNMINLLPAVALRILIWSEYHEGILGLTRYYSLNFIKYSHFTSQGVIDNKAVAKDMIKDVRLSIKQKYKLACIYCLKKCIFYFFRKIIKNKKNTVFDSDDFRWMEKPKIVKFWTCQLMGVVDNEFQNFAPQLISIVGKSIISSIVSGSIEALKYFLEWTPFISRDEALIFGVTQALSEAKKHSDWIVFRDERFDDSKESWTPNYFYVDILCFLLSNMTKTQQENALNDNIYDEITVLELFLCWPYQDYFMKTAAILWDLIPWHKYAMILLKVCDKIEPRERKNLLYGEEKSYDYKTILVDFWSQSPGDLKNYVLLNKTITYWNPKRGETKTGIGLLLKLISLKKFTYKDEEIIWLILESATSEERENLTSANLWSSTCISILKKGKFEIFDRLLLLLCKSEQETTEFKKKLNLHEVAESICSDFLKYSKVNAVKSLISRISLADDKLRRLKKKIIYSDQGMQYCRKLLSSNRYEDFKEFIEWFLPSNNEEIEYKRELAIKASESFPVHDFSGSEIRDIITGFTRSKLPNPEAIREFKTSVAYTIGRAICEDLIAGSSIKVVYDEKNSSIRVESEFTGGQCGRVDEFLRWSLSNDMKIHDFKNTFCQLASNDIHFQLIKARQWKVAKRFLEWLPLTDQRAKTFKKSMIFNHNATWSMFHNLVFEEDDEMRNLETIDLFLRWHLTDRESIIEFRDYFFDAYEDFDEAGLNKFNSLVENYLDDLKEFEKCHSCGSIESRFFRILAGGCERRKPPVFPPQQKRRFSQSEVEGKQSNENGSLGRRKSLRLLNKSQKP